MVEKIEILPEELVDKIAAGEVVERPASVVKELVENSIDAGAKNIRVEIKKGGIKFIRVTDDGSGMDEENSTLAFQRHATSKIKSVDDLSHIATLGFRGEALPSIASVSFVDLLTRTSESISGTRLKIEGGVIKEKKQTGAPVGTSVVVREIFYNVPARRKFLRTVLTETRHIVALLTKFAIAYPEISFKLKSDQRELLSFTRAEDLRDRIKEVFGKDQFEKMVEIPASDGFPNISGFLGKPEIARSNRAELYLFVNRRSIVSRSLYHAVQAGYGELIPKGRFPFAILFLQIDPKLLDVNVHPTKNEVRFADERGVHDFVQSKIKDTLCSTKIIPDFKPRREKAEASRFDSSKQMTVYPPKLDQFSQISSFSSPFEIQKDQAQRKGLEQELTQDQSTSMKEEKATEEKIAPTEVGNHWQLADTYILSQVKGNLVILDQHAAHERILYEEALKNLTKAKACSQQILFPTVSELTPKEFQILKEHKELITKLGFEIKHFGGRTILVTAVPAIIKNKSGEVFLRGILSQLEEEEKTEKDRLKALAKSFACHGAIKAGERLTQEEMQGLVRGLFSTQEPYSCPHGRPTVIKLPLGELNKRFGRS